MSVFKTTIKHRLADYPGAIPEWEIRLYFEHLINSTSKLFETICLDRVEVGDREDYSDADTRAFFMGFAMGMRCSERMNQQ